MRGNGGMRAHLCLLVAVVSFSSGCCKKPVIIAPYSREFIPYETFPNDIVVHQGHSFHLRCTNSIPVIWEYKTFIRPIQGSSVNISMVFNNLAKTYVSELKVTNASRRQTGEIYCRNNISRSNNEAANSDSVYVYIKDPHNLFVTSEDRVPVNQVEDDALNISACRTTSPDVDVWLQLDYVESDEVESNLNQRFGSRLGFILKNVHSGLQRYRCNGTRMSDNFQQSIGGDIIYAPLPKPYINSTIFHAGAGSKLALQCIVNIDHENLQNFELSWLLPNGASTERITNRTSKSMNTEWSSTLTINQTRPSDSGEYTCVVADHAEHTKTAVKTVTIFPEGTNIINITEQDPIESSAGKTVKWVVPYFAHPVVDFKWTFKGKELSKSEENKYLISSTGTETKLEIRNIREDDSGVYMLNASNSKISKTVNFTLKVNFSPRVYRQQSDEQFYTHHGTYNFSCNIRGYPEPKVTWYFRRCDEPPNCTQKDVEIHSNKIIRSGSMTSYNLRAEVSGYITCFAENSEGNASRIMPFWITDVKDGFEVSSRPAEVFSGDSVTLECGASKYNYTDNITWSYMASSERPVVVRNSSLFDVQSKVTQFSYKSTLTLSNATAKNSGQYICNIVDKLNFNRTASVNVLVKEPKAPVILLTNMKMNEIHVKTQDEVNLTCKVSGTPKPVVTWFKDGVLLDGKSKAIRFDQDNQTIVFFAVIGEGTYSCIATNKVGTVSKSITLTYNDKSSNNGPIIAIGVILLVVVVLFVLLVKKIMKEKKLRKEVREMGLEQFEKGAIECINQELPIDDQAELLPYDRKFEFPSEKLTLGKQLGAGAFGVVMKADAEGITEGEAITTVAVKMVKRNADATYIKALASELKIMVHLGKHLNVVNLLGACTKNLVKRELYVIVEYCRYGNLHNYLLRHRRSFVDQVDPVTRLIDPNIGADVFTRHEMISAKFRKKYSGLSFTRARVDSEMSVEFHSIPSSSDSRDGHSVSMTPDGSYYNSGDEGTRLSNNSIQPEWRSNYCGDYKGHVMPICTGDLVCWAFQVARGMEYLAGRKVLHGDLAARNILLSDDNIVKICDFGLAKSMYKSDNYQKKSNGPMPIKWLAIESIRDRVFSTQSDVWSFGIVLWEFFSLAKTPYPGMEADDKLLNKLEEGYRMDKPEYATDEIYHIMDRCWKSKPCSRPSFAELAERLGNMLDDSVKMHYIDLNGPYMSMNVHWREGQQSDYLAMATDPTYANMVTPAQEADKVQGSHYVNGFVFVEPVPGTSREPEEPPEVDVVSLKKLSIEIEIPPTRTSSDSAGHYSTPRDSTEHYAKPRDSAGHYAKPRDSVMRYYNHVDVSDEEMLQSTITTPTHSLTVPVQSGNSGNYVSMNKMARDSSVVKVEENQLISPGPSTGYGRINKPNRKSLSEDSQHVSCNNYMNMNHFR